MSVDVAAVDYWLKELVPAFTQVPCQLHQQCAKLLSIFVLAQDLPEAKRIIALLEPNTEQGGLTERDCRAILRDEKILESTPFSERLEEMEGMVAEWSSEWAEPVEPPTPQQIEEALFAQPPLLW